jgi:hypothetical protein
VLGIAGKNLPINLRCLDQAARLMVTNGMQKQERNDWL